MGIEVDGVYKIILHSGFEGQCDILLPPPSYYNPALFNDYNQVRLMQKGVWYLERPAGKALIGEVPSYPVHSGSRAVIFDTTSLIAR